MMSDKIITQGRLAVMRAQMEQELDPVRKAQLALEYGDALERFSAQGEETPVTPIPIGAPSPIFASTEAGVVPVDQATGKPVFKADEIGPRLAEELFAYHGGQHSAVYALASAMSGHPDSITPDLVRRAIKELLAPGPHPDPKNEPKFRRMALARRLAALYGITDVQLSAQSAMSKLYQNPYCDGAGQGSCSKEVRQLSFPGGRLNLCRAHFDKEMAWRKERNKDLGEAARYDIPSWESLPIVTDPQGRPANKTLRPRLRKAGMNFRTTQPQKVLDGNEEKTVVYVGKDPLTGTTLYAFDEGAYLDGGDPRGILGAHATDWLWAEEYGATGPDIAFSWATLNDNRAQYERALAYAQRKWGIADKPAKSAGSRIGKGICDDDLTNTVFETANDSSWWKEELGDATTTFGWYALVLGHIEGTDDELKAYILHEDDQGFKDVSAFESEAEARAAWSDLQEEYAQFEAESELDEGY